MVESRRRELAPLLTWHIRLLELKSPLRLAPQAYCGDCVFCKRPKINLCTSVRSATGAGLMKADMQPRFSYEGVHPRATRNREWENSNSDNETILTTTIERPQRHYKHGNTNLDHP